MSYVSVSPGVGAIDFSSRSLVSAPSSTTSPAPAAPRVTLPVRMPIGARAPIVRAPVVAAPTPPPDVQLPVGPPEKERREKEEAEKKQKMLLIVGIGAAAIVAVFLLKRKQRSA